MMAKVAILKCTPTFLGYKYITKPTKICLNVEEITKIQEKMRKRLRDLFTQIALFIYDAKKLRDCSAHLLLFVWFLRTNF